MKLLLLILIFIVSLQAKEDIKDSPFIDKQIKLTYQMNDANISQEEASKLVLKQEEMYQQALYSLMANKSKYINNLKDFNAEIFSLKKIISINKRAGNRYAVTRDEVQIKSYLIVRNINNTIKNILISLNTKTIEEFEKKLNELTSQNQQQLLDITKQTDYSKFLSYKSNSKVLKTAQNNIREYYALIEINSDMIAHMYKFEKKMYRLNKFSKYHIIEPVLIINSSKIIQIIDEFLDPFGLSVIKLIIISLLITFIYILRKLFYILLSKYLTSNDSLNEYAEDILIQTKKSIGVLIIIINIDMVIYIYNNFSSIDSVSKVFDIVYTMILTYIVYIVVNIIAT
ncbi:MAG: mechanosensitive ion channel family protein, partial [Campylobacterales bacterium]